MTTLFSMLIKRVRRNRRATAWRAPAASSLSVVGLLGCDILQDPLAKYPELAGRWHNEGYARRAVPSGVVCKTVYSEFKRDKLVLHGMRADPHVFPIHSITRDGEAIRIALSASYAHAKQMKFAIKIKAGDRTLRARDIELEDSEIVKTLPPLMYANALDNDYGRSVVRIDRKEIERFIEVNFDLRRCD